MTAFAPHRRRSVCPEPPLLPRLAAGDESALGECYRRYGRLVRRIARELSDDGDVEDACQDVFVSVWRSAATFDAARGSELSFIATIARRRLIDRTRASANRARVEVQANASLTPALDDYLDGRAAIGALSACSHEQRAVIALAELHDLSHTEIARELSMPLGTVKSHYTRGIERVRRALRRGVGSPPRRAAGANAR